MISPELLRRYPTFAGLTMDQMMALAKTAGEKRIETGQYFFREEEEIQALYLVLEGAVAIVIEIPEKKKEIVVSTVGPGEIFGWSSLLDPVKSSATAKATTPCRVVTFDSRQMKQIFEQDPRCGYIMMQRIAGVVRDRLNDSHIQSLAFLDERTGTA
jgi:CRP/FNR family cyclic AMP-dependent transcriptional regulator